MARYEKNHMDRDGHVFYPHQADAIDLSDNQILSESVDTIRQLFTGIPDLNTLNDIHILFETTTNPYYQINGVTFHLKKMGKRGGYRFMLQNNAYGLIILFGSFYSPLYLETPNNGIQPLENPASHLKMELSPGLIYQHDDKDLDDLLMSFAQHFLEQCQYSGIAAHLAVDVKNWDIPRDIFDRLKCSSKKKVAHNGSVGYETDLMSTAIMYGDYKTVTFGSASSTQFTIYDKTDEAILRDTIDYHENRWRSKMTDAFTPVYKSGDKVTRFELRLHHTVIDQYSTNEYIKNPEGFEYIDRPSRLFKYILPLWQDNLTNKFFLIYNSTRLDPMWSMLIKDVKFNAMNDSFCMKRHYKKPGAPSTGRQLGLQIGTTVALLARKPKTTPESVLRHYQQSELWEDLTIFYCADLHLEAETAQSWNEFCEEFFLEKFEKLLIEKRIMG